ncbi:MAG: MBL fold metallo-hydrolase [Bacteroidetes bacterium]|nr:MBL fold metallo-hydrolase [Bacteroidota bacterium]
MKITFLGTGTSQGVPVIACPCKVCSSDDFRDKRLRCSVLVETKNGNFVIDTGPDFRQQMLREQVTKLDAVLYTHEHKDHTAGMDDIRAFNYFQEKHMEMFLTEQVENALRREFAYVFAEDKYPGIPLLNLNRITESPFKLLGMEIIPIPVSHYILPVFGYRIGNFCYITDAKYIDPKEFSKMRNLDVLVLNALRREKHVSHLTLDEALQIIDIVKPQKAYLTHLSHQMGLHEDISIELPPHVEIAYDGLKLEIIDQA